MDGNTGYPYTTPTSTDYNTFDADSQWRNPQIDSPDDPIAANEIFRMGDDPALDRSAFASDPEQFEHFERTDGIVDHDWDPYQTSSQGRHQRDREVPLNSLVDRHDSIVTAEGQGENHKATQPEVCPASQIPSGGQPAEDHDVTFGTHQHQFLFGRHVDEPHDQNISEVDWQYYESGIKENFDSNNVQPCQIAGTTVGPRYGNAFMPGHSSPRPSSISTHTHGPIARRTVPQASLHGDSPGSLDAREDPIHQSGVYNAQPSYSNFGHPPVNSRQQPDHGNTAHFGEGNRLGRTLEGYPANDYDDDCPYLPSNALQPPGYEEPVQENNEKYAYLEPPPGDRVNATHSDEDLAIPIADALHPSAPFQHPSSAAQNQRQAVASMRCLSDEDKTQLANLVRGKQVAYGDRINAMILNHEIDHYPPMPLIPYPKQQDKTSIDHGLPDQYEHLSTEEILAGAVHPDQMFGGLILRLSKTYNNKDLGDRIDALLGKKMDRSTYTFRISNAVRAFALRVGITTEEFRARLNQQRPAQASRS